MWKITSKEINHTYNKKRLNNRQRNIIRVLVLLVSIIVLLGIGGFVAYNAGIIPIKELLEIKEPIGSAEEININKTIDKYPEIKNIPYIYKLKHELYRTDVSMDAVANDYQKKLEDNGYTLKYDGIISYKGIPYQYYGFLKGFIMIGIIMTSAENVSFGHETMVLYTTGSVFDYNRIITWLKEEEFFIDTP
jgi:hypothetical protein